MLDNPLRECADRPTVMVVHAHPDDESSQTGGTLAHYAAQGYRTVLVTCTDGAQGSAADGSQPGQPGHDRNLVARTRSAELRRACDALEISDTFALGHRDTGLSSAADPQSYSCLPLGPLVAQMLRMMRMLAPDIVVTYPPDGLSGHPDHIRTHDVVAAAHARLVDDATNAGYSRMPPPLYYISLSARRLEALRSSIHARLGPDAWAPPSSMAVDDRAITTVIDVDPYWDKKLQALAAHASQPDAAGLLSVFKAHSDTSGKVEEYVRAYPPPQPGAPVSTDLFLSTDDTDVPPPRADRRR
jgi:LmbE family N-acetylglucosaminyl deacetylase